MDAYERLNKMDRRYGRCHWFVMGAFVRAVRRHLRGRMAQNLLDVGTGSGTAVIKMGALLPEALVCGLDKKEDLIRLARQKAGVGCRQLFLVGDVEGLPFRNDVFDCVIGKFTFCYWKDPVKGISEIKRVMKPNGVGIFFEANPKSILGRLYVGSGIGNIIFRELAHDESYEGVFNPAFSLGVCYPAHKIRELFHQAGVRMLSIKKKLLGAFYLIVFDFSPPSASEAGQKS
jgi:ubiquinone/menaquinone biosynthesis C-methylase UbiE